MLFGTFAIAGSGLGTHRKWLDAISDNIANVNTVRATSEAAFQERFVVATSRGNGDAAAPSGAAGVDVTEVRFGDAEGRLAYQPEHPLADAEGYVRMPDVDLADQMSNLILAQRGYQANLAVVERAQAAYQAAISLGK